MSIKLKDIRVPLSKLFLDPDNYRVAKKTDRHKSSSAEIRDLQNEIFGALKKQKLADLKDSILKNGFLTVDRIVVTRLDDDYLVIEGNRRVAAYKSLVLDYEKGFLEDSKIGDLIEQSHAISAVLIEGSEDEIRDYSDALMGIRHVSGAKKWHGWQSAKLVNSMYENGKSLSDIGLMLGISSIDAGRRMRGYKAFQQLENDSLWGEKKEAHHYGLLLEFLAPNKNAKQWLGWSDSSKSFESILHLHRVYRAITKKDDDTYEVRNIDDAREFIKRLETPLGQQRIMEVVDYKDIRLEELRGRDADLESIVALLKVVSKEQISLPEDKALILEIIELAEGLLEHTNE